MITISEIIINTANAVAKALPNVFLSAAVGVLGAVQLGIVAATPIPKAAQFGMDEIIDSPTNLLVGEGSGPERVQVTPLVDENRFGPEGGGPILNISFEGNVLSDDFITEEVVPKLREAIMRGESIN